MSTLSDPQLQAARSSGRDRGFAVGESLEEMTRLAKGELRLSLRSMLRKIDEYLETGQEHYFGRDINYPAKFWSHYEDLTGYRDESVDPDANNDSGCREPFRCAC